MSWASLRPAILSSYPMAIEEGPDALRLVLASKGDPAVRVGLRIRATSAYGEPVVMIAADLGAADAIDAIDALVTNAILAHGALASRDGVLELRAVLGLRDLSWKQCELALRKLAAEAAELKARMSAPAGNTDAFAHLAD